MVLLRSRVTYVGDWATGDLGEIHVVRPASGPKLPHSPSFGKHQIMESLLKNKLASSLVRFLKV
jgi:hypothetical protein